MTSSALQRHRSAHLSPALAAIQAERAEQGERLVDRIERLIRDIEHVRDSAKADGPELFDEVGRRCRAVRRIEDHDRSVHVH